MQVQTITEPYTGHRQPHAAIAVFVSCFVGFFLFFPFCLLTHYSLSLSLYYSLLRRALLFSNVYDFAEKTNARATWGIPTRPGTAAVNPPGGRARVGNEIKTFYAMRFPRGCVGLFFSARFMPAYVCRRARGLSPTARVRRLAGAPHSFTAVAARRRR